VVAAYLLIVALAVTWAVFLILLVRRVNSKANGNVDSN